MNSTVRYALVLLVPTLLCTGYLLPQSFSPRAFADTAISLNEYIARNLDKFITPEYLKRHDRMRYLQRTGYASLLMETVRHDPVGAFLEYISMNLLLDYSQNMGPIYYPSQRGGYELPFDRTFPADPWKPEWWRR